MAYTTALRKRNAVVVGTLALGAVGLLLYWWFTHPRSDAEAIRRVLVQTEQAAERHEVGGVMRHFSDEYLDDAGNSKRVLGQLAASVLRGAEPLEVVVNNPKIKVSGKSATVEAKIEVVSHSEVVFTAVVTVDFEKERPGGWKIVSSEGWQGAIQ